MIFIKNKYILGIVFLGFILITGGCTHLTASQTQINVNTPIAQIQPQVQKIINETHNVAEKVITEISNRNSPITRNYSETISQGGFTFIPFKLSGKLNISVNTSSPSNIYVVNNTLKQLYYAITQEQPVYFMQPILRTENRGCTETKEYNHTNILTFFTNSAGFHAIKVNYVGSKLNCNIHKNYNHIGLLIINNGKGNNQANITIRIYKNNKGIINIIGNKNTINLMLKNYNYNSYRRPQGTPNYLQYPIYKNLYNEFKNKAHYRFYLYPLNSNSYEAQNNADIQSVFNVLTSRKLKNQQRAITFLVNEIKEITSNRNTQAQIGASLIGNIPYNYTELYNALHQGLNFRFKYPYQVLYNGGICSESTILSAYILKELGFNAGIFYFPAIDHTTAAIRVPWKKSWRSTGYAIVSSVASEPIGYTIYEPALLQSANIFPTTISTGAIYTGTVKADMTGNVILPPSYSQLLRAAR